MGTAAQRSQWVIDKTEAVARDGMVAAMQPLAAEAGAEMLRRGGNAIDAAVATAFAVGVVEPFMSGVGGIAFLTYRDATTGETICIDGSTVLPAAIRPELFELLPADQRAGMYGWRATKDDANNTGWLSPGVPGTPALLGEAHRRFGRLPWATVLEPAIRLAGQGFEANYYVSICITSSYDLLKRLPAAGRVFIKPNGSPPAPPMSGQRDLIVQTDLAHTLRLIASEGADTIYRGTVARMIAEDMRRHGGLISEADLAAHQARVLPPASIDYRGYQILGQLECSGYATVAEALKILEGFDLGAVPFQSAGSVHLITESMRRAFVDRLRYLGDPDLMPVPLRGVIDARYATERRATIDPRRADPNAGPGDPWPYDPSGASFQPARSGAPGDGNTTHISVIDRDRNMVALTSTLGGLFGSGVMIEGTGILLNNAVTWFDPEPGAVASIGPGKRTMSASTPVVVLRDGHPYAAIGAPGARRVMSSIYQVLVNLIDYGQGIQAAISAPRTHAEGPATEISTRVPAEVRDELAAMGHQLEPREDGLSSSFFARPNGVRVDPETGDLHGGVFPYGPATAIGV